MLVTRLRQTFAAGLLACGLIGVGGALAQQLGGPVAQDPPVVRENLPPDTDPFVAQPKKAAEPKKVAAKGVEDDDVPYGSSPAQAVVRIEEGKLLIRQRTQAATYYEPTTQTIGDRAVTSYQMKSSTRVAATTHDPADIAVFDMKGNRLSPKAWKEMLKSDVHALIANDGKLPNPRELTLFKQDTLLIVLPAGSAPPAYAPIPTSGTTFNVPTAPGVPAAPSVTTVRPGNVPPSAVPAPATRPVAPRATPARPPTVPQPGADPLTPPPALIPEPERQELPGLPTPTPIERS